MKDTSEARRMTLQQRLTDGPSPLFAEAHERLKSARRARADLNNQARRSQSKAHDQALDAIDDDLFQFAWNLVGSRARSLDDFAIKAKFVQEYIQAEPGQFDSEIVMSLCCDLIDLVHAHGDRPAEVIVGDRQQPE